MSMHSLYLLVPLAPLAGSLLAGLFGRQLGRAGSHTVTILGVALSFLASLVIARDVFAGHLFNGPVYTWLSVEDITMSVGFLIDPLTVTMMLVVTFVSLMVHIYTIGYMEEDPGYQRFFSYISLFTFSMLMLVMANNFLQLFFGWEAVGLVSYLLIGFWYTRPTAIYANLKAFLVNRVGDLGFLLGIGLILAHFGSLDYATVFERAPLVAHDTIELVSGSPVSLMTVVCILLFIGAMGKSAQMPLHVWLPDSMEGPTPISALIHAATMVTAGIFMVSRMSPLFELSETARSVVLVIGASTALFMAFLGIIQNDIKRVVAYSTLSQLGYMTVALGASAYPVAIFHLGTHAFFKALLFLGAGSVIHAMHHEQDMRNMGGLRKYMPITYVTALIGSLALSGIPPFAGFFSKDAIIEAVQASSLPGAGYATFAVMAGVFVTAFYSFRMLFMTFHGKPRMDEHTREHLHESPWVITLPLILLAIPSVVAGYMAIDPMVMGNYFGNAITVLPGNGGLHVLREEWHGVGAFMAHGVTALPFWLAIAGIACAAAFYLKWTGVPDIFMARLRGLYTLLDNKYYFDRFNEIVFAGGAREVGTGLWRVGDMRLIDGVMVNGSANLVGRLSARLRRVQTGYIYHYAFIMIFGVFILMSLWFVKA
ncbi:MAG: NADH-quinone oxidoreductase subunit L [Betaproteobacteria bacterium]|nr:NADH-quinone oxidoreductase subunit L [Betaproteobacteria bacterium]MDE2623233.1 NADH-quinone oxidoreductase subunit L [Betaproteobacteria bacterium]